METEPRRESRSPSWSFIFSMLAVANLLTVALPIAGFASIEYQTRHGDAGAGYGAIILWPLALVGVGVLIANFVLVGRYLQRRRPAAVGQFVGYSFIAVSVVLLLGGVYLLIDSSRDARQRIAAFDERQQAHQKSVTFTDITVAEAERLLRSCDLRGFYYTRQTRPALGGGGEFSPTGVVLTTIGGDPHRISIADRWIKRLVPVAEQAQDDCGPGRPQIWHHGSYQ